MFAGKKWGLLVVFVLLGLCVTTWAAAVEKTVEDPGLYLPIIRKPPGPWWAKTYGLRSHIAHIAGTSDGGSVLAGCTVAYIQCGEAWIAKLDADGDITWSKSYGGSGIDQAWYIVQTNDGGYVVAASTQAYGAGATDVWILLLDNDGTIVWQKTYGGVGDDWARKILPAENGAFVVSGMTDSFGSGDSDVWLLKLNSDGNIAWQRTVGGGNYDSGIAGKTSDGDYMIAGSTASFGAGGGDAWVLKMDGSGTVDWQKTYGSSSDDIGSRVLETGDGGYVVLGATNNYGAGSYDTWVLRLRSDGSLAWQKTYGGSEDDFALGLKQMPDGGFLLSGYTLSFGAGYTDAWFMKLDSNGNVAWQKTYGDRYYDVVITPAVETSDGSFLLAGRTSSFGMDSEAWVLRVDRTGDIANCRYVGKSNVMVETSTSVVNNSSATVQATTVLPVDSSAVPQEVPAQASVVCLSFIAGESCGED